MTRALPSADEVLALPAEVVEVAPPEWEDHNGHVNVVHYYALHMRGADRALQELGITDDYRARTGWSTFSVEHHLTFLDEVHVGDELSVHLRMIDRGEKVMHAVSLIVNRSTGRLVNVLEFVEGHVDLTTRRTCPWEPALADRIDAVLREHADLPWAAPVAGPMGVRR
ncbi:thioesterase family protein [Kribbia dieselivorans]|uniref:thioesterase family protein n=1 Tax=Kribbia dieselivorans TaxID=331526 RepID=UPI000839A158|nr:thioesterase family protein [Kribbia dieselivorans]